MTATFLTRRDYAADLEKLGVTGVAQECILRETARARHLSRVAFARQVAEEWWLNATGASRDNTDDRILALGAGGVLWLDVVGIGGRESIGGDSTRRHPAFASCGKGRKKATDGEAWSAAILQAALDTDGEFGVVDSELAFLCRDDHGKYVILADGSPWEYTVLRLGLSHAAKSAVADWYDRTARLFAPYDADVTAGEWAAALNAHVARVEAMAALAIEEPDPFEKERGMDGTLEHEIHRHRDGVWVGFAYLTAEQRETLARDHGPEGVVRFEWITSGRLAADHYMSPDHRNMPIGELVRIECMYGPYRDAAIKEAHS